MQRDYAGYPIPRCTKPRGLRHNARSDGVGAFFAGADADEAVDVADPDLAVTDLAGGGRAQDGVDDQVDTVLRVLDRLGRPEEAREKYRRAREAAPR